MELSESWRLAILFPYAAGVFIIMMVGGQPDQLGQWLLSLVILAWCVTPIAALCLLPYFVLARGIAAVLMGFSGCFFYWHTLFVLPPDAQSALVFVVLPFYQLIAVAIFNVFLAFIAWRKEE